MSSHTRLAWLVAVALLGCNQSHPVWDLSKPIAVQVDSNLPKADMFKSAAVRAIKEAGGIVAVSEADIEAAESDDRVIDIAIGAEGADPYCPKADGPDVYPVVEAYSFSRHSTIYACRKTAMLTIKQNYVDAIVIHELGHLLRGAPGHLLKKCANFDVMDLPTSCHLDKTYTVGDIAFICGQQHAIHGKCS